MRATVLATAICFSLVGLARAGDVSATIKLATDIPPQPLAPALQTLIKERDIQLVYRAELVGDRRTAGATGDLTAVEALNQLLSGTGLTYRYLDEKTITILPIAAGDAKSDGVVPSQAASSSSKHVSPDQANGAAPSTAQEVQKKSFWDRFHLAQADSGTDVAGRSTVAANNTDSSSTVLAEVVVTGQKRVENVQEVPKQVTVVNQAQLTTAGVTRITDLQTVFPSVTGTDQGQNTKNPGIRGIAPIANSVGIQSQTGIIVDDIPQSTFSTLANELTDIERVEVFPGPQTTLSGRNAAGGLINFVTRSPSNTPEYDLKVEQTTDTQTRASAFLTGPVSDSLAYSLSVVYNNWDGNLRNALRGNERVGGFDTKGVRAKLRWTPTDKLIATVTGYFLDTDRETGPLLSGGAFVGGPLNATFIFDAENPARPVSQLYPGLNLSPSNHTVYSPYNGDAKQRDRGGSVRVDYDLDQLGTASSLTSYTYSTQPRDDVFIGAPRDNLVVNVTNFDAFTDVRTKYFTQELRLTSPGTGPFTYLAGAIYTDTRLTEPYFRPQLFPVNWDRTVSIKSSAVFARGTYEFTSADSLTAGLRYQHDQLGYTWLFHQINPTDPNTFSSGDSGYGFAGGEVSLKHKFTDEVNAYVTYSQSQTGQAFDVEDNATASKGTLTPLASEHVHNWEVGFKSEWFDRRVIFNADLFWAEYRNYQIQTITTGSLNSVPVIRLLAIGAVQSRGAEVSTAFQVTPDFRVSLDGALADTHIKSFPNAACYTGQTVAQGCVNGTQGDLSGLPLPYASRWKFTATADYSWPLQFADLNFGGFYRYQSSQHYDVLGDPLTYQGGFGTLNLYAGPQSHDGKWSVQLFVNNLVNHTYYDSLAHPTFYTLNGINPMITAGYDRSSFRYGGIRAQVRF